MTDKDERMKDAVAELRFASDGIVNMLAANLTPKESFMRDLAADLSYAASAIASQAAEIAALKERLRWRDAAKEQPRDGVLQLVVAGGNYELMYKTNSKYWNYDPIPAWWMPLQDIPGNTPTLADPILATLNDQKMPLFRRGAKAMTDKAEWPMSVFVAYDAAEPFKYFVHCLDRNMAQEDVQEYIRADIADELRKSRDHHASTIFIQEGRIASQAAEIAALQKDLVRYNEPSPMYVGRIEGFRIIEDQQP